MQAMLERDSDRPLKARCRWTTPMSAASGRAAKRGRGAEGKTPLAVAVQVTDDEMQPVGMKPSLAEGFTVAELERRARERLKPGTTVRSDGPGCFGGVEKAGCEHARR